MQLGPKKCYLSNFNQAKYQYTYMYQIQFVLPE